jgi:hypothetical protein
MTKQRVHPQKPDEPLNFQSFFRQFNRKLSVMHSSLPHLGGVEKESDQGYLFGGIAFEARIVEVR